MAESVETLEGMNETQLRELIQRAQDKLRERAVKRLEELRGAAREAGYEVTITKIGEGESRRGRKRSGSRRSEGDDRRREVSPKYQNPDNPKERWTGRGRKPRWVVMALTHGRNLEDLTIKAA